MTNTVISSQAKLLARYLKANGFATLSHSQALEAIAHAMNFKSYNEAQAAAKSKATSKSAQSPATRTDRALELLAQARKEGLTSAQALSEFAKDRTPAEQLYLKHAQENCNDEGELEFDDNAMVSMGDDAGAYVMGWYWVSASELTLPEDPIEALALPRETICVEIGDNGWDIPMSCIETNASVIEQLKAGKAVPPDTWIIRETGRIKEKDADLMQLEVRHIKAMTLDEKGQRYQGKLNGEELLMEFPD